MVDQTKTREQVRSEMDEAGVTINEWAQAHQFDPAIVSQVLRGKLQGKRGTSHAIAVALGLKRGRDRKSVMGRREVRA